MGRNKGRVLLTNHEIEAVVWLLEDLNIFADSKEMEEVWHTLKANFQERKKKKKGSGR